MFESENTTPEKAILLFQENTELRSQLASVTQKLTDVERQLAWFRKQIFGQKSERRIVGPTTSALGVQMWLGEAFEPKEEQEPVAAEETVKEHVRRRSKRGEVKMGDPESLLRFDPSIPVEEVTLPAVGIEGLSEDQYEVIDNEESYKLAQTPSSYVILKYVRPVIKIKESGKIHTAPVPPMVADRSFSDVSFYAGMLVDKFVYHMPLNRQFERLKAFGVTVSRATLPSQAIRAIELLEPIYQAQMASVLASQVIAMDDTWMKVGVASPGKMHKGHFWPIYGDQDEIIFPYAESRRDEEVGKLLGNYKGVLLADGHDAYDKYAARHAEVVRAQCWVHTRRNFFELDGPVELRKGALDRIGRMYEIEERIRKKKLFGEAKVAYRGEHAKPIVEEFFEWLAQVSRERMLLPTDPFLKAAVYVLKRKDALRVYISHPDVPMDTNHEERALRVIPMGRRNYLFCWSELGAVCVGRIQSLLVTCKLHGIDPYTYLVDVLQRIQTHPFSEVALLTPRLWKKYFAQDPMVSPLEMLRRQKYADASKKMG